MPGIDWSERADRGVTADALTGALAIEGDEQPAVALTKTHATPTTTRMNPEYYKFVFGYLLSDKDVKWAHAIPLVFARQAVIAAAGRHRSG
jgi:hypothetical protein